MEKASNLPLKRGIGSLIRRFTLGLGLAILISPISAAARDRSSSPRRHSRAIPPWSEPGRRLPPPRPSGSAEASRRSAHPALHGFRRATIRPLFPRAGSGDDARDARLEAMANHPAGKGRPNDGYEVQVRSGDSLWSIAEERVETERVTECWPKLYTANRATIGGDPNHIEPGQRLTVPEECR